MTYAETHGQTEYDSGSGVEPGTREFFDRLDRQFYDWNRPLHGQRPFDRLFPYDEYRGKPVLEVGCGLGTMAMNWAQAGASVTAVDLNPTAVAHTRTRFELHGLEGEISEADGRSLAFPDESFDYAWSWGVLHHSPDLGESLSELVRVLRPGGRFGVMLYNRRSFLHWYTIAYLEGVVHREREFLSPLELASRYSDAGREEGNPHTWPITREEGESMLRAAGAADVSTRILGTDLEGVLDTVFPRLGTAVPTWAKKPWARRFGWSLWFSGRKP
jgi:ubiquinone/menaquinone biosynthesis C-methylase UbiE